VFLFQSIVPVTPSSADISQQASDISFKTGEFKHSTEKLQFITNEPKAAHKSLIKECQIVLIDVMNVPNEDQVKTSTSSDKVGSVVDKKVQGLDCASLETVRVPPSTNSENFPVIPSNSSETPLSFPPTNSTIVTVSPPTSSDNCPVVPPISSNTRPVSPKTFLRLYYANQPIANVTKSPATHSETQMRSSK
jgi:hypothetical protein